MHTALDVWDSQKMITHLINNDLKNERMRYDFGEEKYNFRRSTLFKAIFILLGITEPMLHIELSKQYRKLKREINDQAFSEKSLKLLSEKIFSEMVIKTGKNAALERQRLYEKKNGRNTDFQKVVVNMIKNDLMQKYNLEQLADVRRKYNYDFDLGQPVLWLMKVWDRNWQLKFTNYYSSEMDRIITRSQNLSMKYMDLYAAKIYNGVHQMKGNLVC